MLPFAYNVERSADFNGNYPGRRLEFRAMDKREHLEFQIGPQLIAAGGILDKIDYNEVRALGNQLRNIPYVSDNWDTAPANLAGWVSSYRAMKRTVGIASESGLLSLLQEYDEELRECLSPETIPQSDGELVGKDSLYAMIDFAKKSENVKRFDPEGFQNKSVSEEELARALVVNVHLHLSWSERPRVDEKTGANRLKIGAILGQGVLGGALAGANLSLGVLGNYLPHIAAMVGQVSTTVGIAASTYTGLAKVFEAVEKLSSELKR
jgi:hypothetical protein